MESQEIRYPKAPSLAQATSGGRPGEPRYRRGRGAIREWPRYRGVATLLDPLRQNLGTVYPDGADDNKASHQLITCKGTRTYAGLWDTGHLKIQRGTGHAKRKTGAQEEGFRVSPALVGKDRYVAVQAVNDRKNQSAQQQLGRGSDGECEGDKQAEWPWFTSQKAPSATVTWGWGLCVLIADLGNNARYTLKLK